MRLLSGMALFHTSKQICTSKCQKPCLRPSVFGQSVGPEANVHP